ncbi:MAG: hydroxyacylglutathione hydrolase [Sphingopyxis sp.]|nr:hydroxyacylglutathione hydrolase [Sphingopyxis sp.]
MAICRRRNPGRRCRIREAGKRGQGGAWSAPSWEHEAAETEERRVSALEIVRIPVLSDNYVWLVHDPDSKATMVVDPAVADPVLEAASARGWTITDIWNTHWHPDHTGGNAAIKEAAKAWGGCTITGPAAEFARIPTLDVQVKGGDRVKLGAHLAEVWDVPAHTAGHIAYHFAQDEAIFVGDTMFAMGCGRLFEGTAEQMFANMQQFAALDDATRVYCAHEYTLSNARFAVTVDPDNGALVDRLAAVEAARAAGEPTVPTTIGAERATNPFLRAPTAAELGRIRALKDAA